MRLELPLPARLPRPRRLVAERRRRAGPPVPQGVARRAAITNHYYLELTPEQRMDPRWHPDYRPTWDAFFINRRERALARYEEDGLLRTSTRPAVGCGGVAGLSRASWTTSRPTITPAYATLTSSPGVLTRRGWIHERHPMTATTTTTTRTSIIGLGRSMTKIVRTNDPLLSFRIVVIG